MDGRPRQTRFAGATSAAALGVAVLALVGAPARAFALGRPQPNRAFVGTGGGLFVPASPDFKEAYKPSLGLQLEAGIILGSRTGPSFAVAPTITGKFLWLRDRVPAEVDVTYSTQLLGGMKFGFTWAGLFAYGQIDGGLSHVHYVVCSTKTFDCVGRNTHNGMMRFGMGADFELFGGVALGGYAGFPVYFGFDGLQPAAYELLATSKVLFP